MASSLDFDRLHHWKNELCNSAQEWPIVNKMRKTFHNLCHFNKTFSNKTQFSQLVFNSYLIGSTVDFMGIMYLLKIVLTYVCIQYTIWVELVFYDWPSGGVKIVGKRDDFLEAPNWSWAVQNAYFYYPMWEIGKMCVFVYKE